jgi:Zn-dependent peptidase ImmA (M78 family)
MRIQIETGLGVFVLQSNLGDEDLSGFALVESGPPAVIVLNTVDPPEVRRFTLGHEVYHVIKDESDVVLGSDEDPVRRTDDERSADRFAVELLLPDSKQTKELFQKVFDGTRASVSSLARTLRLSYSFVLYRARSILNLSQSQFQPLVIPRQKTAETKAEKKKTQVDYYTRKASELGYSLPNLVFERTDLGRLDIGTACELLNLKLESFDKFRDASY